MGKNILIIGNSDSIFIKKYVQYVLFNRFDNIFITKEVCGVGKFDNYYEQKNIFLVDLKKSIGAFSKIPRFGEPLTYYYNIRVLQKKYGIDTIHIHYMGHNATLYYLGKLIGKKIRNVVCTFWGSDLLSTPDKSLMLLKPILEAATSITLETEDMRSHFREKFGTSFDNKIKLCYFGNDILPFLDEQINQKNKMKESKYVIAIGYNNNPRQQHNKVLSEIGKLDKSILNNICIVLQLSYGGASDTYIDELRRQVELIGCDSMFIMDFLNESETAKLKKSVDLFIHSQTTDSLSASLIEYFYAGTLVFNPKWIQYKDWDKWGIEYIKYNDFSQLPDLIEKAYHDEISIDYHKNRKIIGERYSWKYVSSAWACLYR